MTHNDVFRAIRHILNVRDAKLIEIIRLAGVEVSLEDVVAYLKSEEEPGYKEMGDDIMAPFLDGLVFFKRGKDESRPLLPTDKRITNNVILKKVRVAFELKDADIVPLIEKSGLKITKSELSAFFRSADHRNFRPCGDQFLRNLLKGLCV